MDVSERERMRLRQEAIADLQRVLSGLAQHDQHVITLSDYEVANLREFFRAVGYGAVVEANPLQVANTGDWLGQIAGKLPFVEYQPNAEWTELARRAREWFACHQ